MKQKNKKLSNKELLRVERVMDNMLDICSTVAERKQCFYALWHAAYWADNVK